MYKRVVHGSVGGAKSITLINAARGLWVGPQACVISVRCTYTEYLLRSGQVDLLWARSSNFQAHSLPIDTLNDVVFTLQYVVCPENVSIEMWGGQAGGGGAGGSPRYHKHASAAGPKKWM